MDDRDENPPRGPDWRAGLGAAVGFFTLLPVHIGAVPLGRVVWAFAPVGALIGLIGGLAYVVTHALGLGPFASAVVAVGATVILTGALHEDGLADTADGLGARGGREARLAAMRDSRIGAFAVLALVLVVAGRITALGEIAASAHVLGAMVAAGALSRAGLAILLQALPPARADGLGHGAGQPTAEAALVAVLIGAALAWLGAGLMATILALVVGGCVLGGFIVAARRLFGGQTGDVLGAAQQIMELAALYCVAALA